MKKIYTLLAAAFICGNSLAQGTILEGFESVTLNSESFNNGSSGAGDFVFPGSILSNYYDDTWGSWNGFSISNITDNTTAGWGNQYSTFTGAGMNSENYAVFYPDGYISGNVSSADYSIDSFFVTNTTFAAISMRDGDAIGKKFGSIYAADGTTVDGTNGEDFLKMWVFGYESEAMNAQKDSVLLFLADYRFADSSQDYILDKWEKVDLTSFTFPVLKVTFRIESSDIGAWGINTPTYFSIDNISSSYLLNVKELNSLKIEVYPNPMSDELIVKGENGNVILRDVKGNIVLSQKHSQVSYLNTSALSSGIYFLEVSNESGRAIQKVGK
jgi:hypothetical protein